MKNTDSTWKKVIDHVEEAKEALHTLQVHKDLIESALEAEKEACNGHVSEPVAEDEAFLKEAERALESLKVCLHIDE